MEMIFLADGVWVLRGGVNLGVIADEGEAIFVDAGLDDGPARRLWRWAEEKGLRPRAAILTHAHADHFGGARFWEAKGLPLFAPPLEAAMMRFPLCEPLFLFCGASPVPELLGKFTLAHPLATVREVEQGSPPFLPDFLRIVALPGHAPQQIGVLAKGVLFCADALFTPQVLAKHPIPFCHDVGQALESLKGLMAQEILVPGHGEPLEGEEVGRAVEGFRGRLLALVEETERALASPHTGEELVALLAQRFAAKGLNVVEFLLVRTTVFAVLSFLVREGRVAPLLDNGLLLWRRR